MLQVLSISSDIKYGVLDILRGLGIGAINIIFSTIDVLYDVAHKINSINFIELLKDMNNSPFTKIFNAFFILSFVVLFLFSVWKISFRILDADVQEQPMFETVKEIVKCGFLIFSIYLIMNTSINLGISISGAIYNNFTGDNSTIGDTMKTAYLSINENCYKQGNGDDKSDANNVKELKKILTGYSSIDDVSTMEDFEKLVRNEVITASNVSDSGAFSYRCNIHVPGIWNDKEDYAFNYNFLFGILVGCVFLLSIGFAVLMLGRRQLELAFLMVISPLVIATSVGRKEQRSALWQQLASLVLQSGALMLLIGLTSIMFPAIQNSNVINSLPYFTKIVSQSILYLGCAMMLMTGSTALNRFIGENVSANSGRDTLMAMRGLAGGFATAGAVGFGLLKTAQGMSKGGMKFAKGLKELGQGSLKTAQGMYHGLASVNPKMNERLASKMNDKTGRGIANVMRGIDLQNSNNGLARAYGRMLESRGEAMVNDVGSKWNFGENRYNPDYVRSGVSLARKGINDIRNGVGMAFESARNIGNPRKNYFKPKLYDYGNEKDKI